MTGGLVELGEILLAAAQQRLGVVSRNIANLTTPGYRGGLSFQAVIELEARQAPLSVSTNFQSGTLQATGRSLDLAMSGPGFFMVRGAEAAYFTRNGQFERAADGRLVNSQGLALQSIDGDDIIVSSSAIEVLNDGMVLDDGVPVARIGVFDVGSAPIASGGAFLSADPAAITEVAMPVVHQGMLETANVDLAQEMTEMMSALRTAEVAARIVQTYDTLMDQSISTWGRSAR